MLAIRKMAMLPKRVLLAFQIREFMMKPNLVISRHWIVSLAVAVIGLLASFVQPPVLLSDAAILQVRGGQGSGGCDKVVDVLDACAHPNACRTKAPNCGTGDCSAACTVNITFVTLKDGNVFEYDGTPSNKCGNQYVGATCQLFGTLCGCANGMDNGQACGIKIDYNDDLTGCG